jgi:hypothetical protein
MRRDDLRGRRVAIVADILINPTSAFYEDMAPTPGPVLDVLAQDGWGLMKAPPPSLNEGAMRAAIASIAGDAQEYAKHGHRLVVIAASTVSQGGLRLDLRRAAMRDVGMPLPPILSVPTDETCAAETLRERLSALVSTESEPAGSAPNRP